MSGAGWAATTECDWLSAFESAQPATVLMAMGLTDEGGEWPGCVFAFRWVVHPERPPKKIKVTGDKGIPQTGGTPSESPCDDEFETSPPDGDHEQDLGLVTEEDIEWDTSSRPPTRIASLGKRGHYPVAIDLGRWFYLGLPTLNGIIDVSQVTINKRIPGLELPCPPGHKMDELLPSANENPGETPAYTHQIGLF